MLDDNTNAYFYLNESHESYVVATVTKKWNGKWKVLSISNNVPVSKHPAQTNPYYWSGGGYKGIADIYWGTLYDDRIAKIMVGENPATIMRYPTYNIWYIVVDSYDQNVTMKAYDEYGNEIPWHESQKE